MPCIRSQWIDKRKVDSPDKSLTSISTRARGLGPGIDRRRSLDEWGNNYPGESYDSTRLDW